MLGLGGVAGNTWTVAVPWLVPLGGLELTLDPLAGLFLALVGGVALPASVFALGSTGRAGRGALAYPVFVASMCVVPLAANTMTFVVAWELMSLASYFLVLHEREERASVRAAWVYAVMTHAGVTRYSLVEGEAAVEQWKKERKGPDIGVFLVDRGVDAPPSSLDTELYRALVVTARRISPAATVIPRMGALGVLGPVN